MTDLYAMHCLANDWTTPADMTLQEVAAWLAEAKTDGECSGEHLIVPASVDSGADAEYVQRVMSSTLVLP